MTNEQQQALANITDFKAGVQPSEMYADITGDFGDAQQCFVNDLRRAADLAIALVAKIRELREAEKRYAIVFKTQESADHLMPELFTLAGIEETK